MVIYKKIIRCGCVILHKIKNIIYITNLRPLFIGMLLLSGNFRTLGAIAIHHISASYCFFLAFGLGKSVIEPSYTSAAKPIDSYSVGCA